VIKTPPDLEETMRNMKDELRSYKADNESLIRSQEKQDIIKCSVVAKFV
jgi:hypothetical protein